MDGSMAFASATMTVEGNKLYRLVLHAPFGASVMMASSAPLQVGDPAKVWKAATSVAPGESSSTSPLSSIGSVVEENGTYEAVLPGSEVSY